ncbi:hypothetical protein BLNAU_24401 [Blattamonas nauphoetae]|uniref:Uncharacterized protein n=1 Tax=Blattamonas nauphoetae TaxID=2049346 RepID=A0ABQ9WMH2_9EUKA|nr:hypothetical protein BLNAU_24401 [Blattamonas nauphoetae]
MQKKFKHFIPNMMWFLNAEITHTSSFSDKLPRSSKMDTGGCDGKLAQSHHTISGIKKITTPHRRAIERELGKTEYFGLSRAEKVTRIENKLHLKKGIVNRVVGAGRSSLWRARRVVASRRDVGVPGRPNRLRKKQREDLLSIFQKQKTDRGTVKLSVLQQAAETMLKDEMGNEYDGRPLSPTWIYHNTDAVKDLVVSTPTVMEAKKKHAAVRRLSMRGSTFSAILLLHIRSTIASN